MKFIYIGEGQSSGIYTHMIFQRTFYLKPVATKITVFDLLLCKQIQHLYMLICTKHLEIKDKSEKWTFIPLQLGRFSVEKSFPVLWIMAVTAEMSVQHRIYFSCRNNILLVVPGDCKFYVLISIENICTR